MYWDTRRGIVLIAVAIVHLGLIGLLLATTVGRTPEPGERPLELVYMPTPLYPRVRADSGRPQRWRADIALSVVAPVLASAPPPAPPSAPSAGSGNRGQGVDWSAEAHRAVRAYEIRRDHPPQNALSGRSPANDWWPQQGPHVGDGVKTESGDWIVWINADCYQLASWHSTDSAPDADPPQIICPGRADPQPSR
jgi:hypothetical protein